MEEMTSFELTVVTELRCSSGDQHLTGAGRNHVELVQPRPAICSFGRDLCNSHQAIGYGCCHSVSSRESGGAANRELDEQSR